MKRKTTVKNRREDQPDMDCDVCRLRRTCQRAASGSFCTRFTSREAPEGQEDPNRAWRQGDPFPC